MLLKYVKAKEFSEKMKKVKGVTNIQPPLPSPPLEPQPHLKNVQPYPARCGGGVGEGGGGGELAETSRADFNFRELPCNNWSTSETS